MYALLVHGCDFVWEHTNRYRTVTFFIQTLSLNLNTIDSAL